MIDNILFLLQRFRSPMLMRPLIERIHSISHKPISIMEVCGSQTVALARYGIADLLPGNITLIHGPGCPVCVTPSTVINEAVFLARKPNVIICTFGDMMRVPSGNGSLRKCRAEGCDVRVVYSPLDTIAIATANPAKHVVFLAIGFETTTPLYAMLLQAAHDISNISLLTSLFTIPAAVKSLLISPQCHIDALLAAGHVCAITGLSEYDDMSDRFKIPIAVTGFEPTDLLSGILDVVTQYEKNSAHISNCYPRAVRWTGNPAASAAVKQYFEPCDSEWRGLGVIENSALRLRHEYEHFDTRKRFNITDAKVLDDGRCISGEIMKGVKTPRQCRCFAEECTPDAPIGASMVSSEGACATFYRFNSSKK